MDQLRLRAHPGSAEAGSASLSSGTVAVATSSKWAYRLLVWPPSHHWNAAGGGGMGDISAATVLTLD